MLLLTFFIDCKNYYCGSCTSYTKILIQIATCGSCCLYSTLIGDCFTWCNIHLYKKVSSCSESIQSSRVLDANTRCYLTNGSSSHSPESGLGTSRTSLHSDAEQDHVDHHSEHVDQVDAGELLDPLGTCRALYPFDGMLCSFPVSAFYLYWRLVDNL